MTSFSEPRRYGMVNWVGFANLYKKEVLRFANVFTQTLLAPVITTLLFLAVFSLALGRAVDTINGIPFTTFLAPGLIVMAMVQNAFANTSSSVMVSKMQGNIIDVLMAPISPLEMVIAYGLGGATRGLVVGTATGIGMSFFVDLPLYSIPLLILFGFLGSLMLSLLGMIAGIWSEKFDQMAAVTNFIITPLSFLSGTFYSISRLPEPFFTIAHFNPFFYMIDGFRYGMIGVSDANIAIGAAVVIAIDLTLIFIAWRMLTSGYKLRS